MNSGEAVKGVPAPLVYEFGDFRLDARLRLLLRRDGTPVKLSVPAFELLLFLVARANTLVDKGAVMEAVWPNAVVEENNLNQHLSVLRRALGEVPGEHRYIVTVPRRGFTFVAQVKVLTSESLPHFASPVARDSIAVLAFANLTGDSSRDFLCDGIAEELIHRLTHVPGLKVPARSSSFMYKGRAVDVRRIARDLGVSVVLEGSLRPAGKRLRVTAHLADGESGFHIWSHSSERDLEDLSSLQEELAGAVLKALRPDAGGEVETFARASSTSDSTAYDLCMQARAIATRPGEENLQTALKMLQLAVARDPGYARAISALAFTRTRLMIFDYAMAGTLAEIRNEAERALSLDSSLSEARHVLGIVSAASGDWVRAEEYFRDPEQECNVYRDSYHSIYVLQSVGHIERARELAISAYRSAPFLPVTALNIALVQAIRGHDAEAARYLAVTEALGYPASVSVLQDVAATLDMRAGNFERAAARMQRTLSAGMRNAGGVEATALVFGALADLGQRADAVRALLQLESAVSGDALNQTDRKRILLWLTQLGALDEAIEFAGRTLVHYRRSANMVGMAWGHLWVSEMRPLRQHAGFAGFAERLGLAAYWRRFGPPDVSVAR